MISRRSFLRQSSLLSFGVMARPEDFFKVKAKIGVQLYTLRDDIRKDAKGTIQKVAALGYKEIETFGYNNGKWFGLNPAELSSVLKANSLTSPSGHTFPGSIFLKAGWEETWKKAIQDSKAIGQKFIVIPYLEPQYQKSADNYKKIAAGLNEAGKIAKSSSIQLAYHNHDFEFVDLEGQTGFQILAKETDPSLVKFEMDIYWVKKAGLDPVALFRKYPGRFVMWHVKDMDNTEKKFFTEVGNGVIDFKSIFANAKLSGMKHFFVEQDVCPGPPLESISKSISYLKSNVVK